MLVVFFFRQGNKTYHWKDGNQFCEPVDSKAILASSVDFYEQKLYSDKGFVQVYTRPKYTSAQILKNVPFILKPEEPTFKEAKVVYRTKPSARLSGKRKGQETTKATGTPPNNKKKKTGKDADITKTKATRKAQKNEKKKTGKDEHSEITKTKATRKAQKKEKKKTEKKPTRNQYKDELKKRGLALSGNLKALEDRLNDFLEDHPEGITDKYGNDSKDSLRQELGKRGLKFTNKTQKWELLLALRQYNRTNGPGLEEDKKKKADTPEKLLKKERRDRAQKFKRGIRPGKDVLVQLKPLEQIPPERKKTKSYLLLGRANAHNKKIRLTLRTSGTYVTFDDSLSEKDEKPLSSINIHTDDILGEMELAKEKALLPKKIKNLDDNFLIKAQLKGEDPNDEENPNDKWEIFRFLDLRGEVEDKTSSGDESYYGDENSDVDWAESNCALSRDVVEYTKIYGFPEDIQAGWTYPEHLNLDFYDEIEAYVGLDGAREKSWQKADKIRKINSHKWEYRFPIYNKKLQVVASIEKKINVLKTQVRIPGDSKEESDDEAEGEEYDEESDEEEEKDFTPEEKVYYKGKEWVIKELLDEGLAIITRKDETGKSITKKVDVKELDSDEWDPDFQNNQYVFFDGNLATIESIDYDKKVFTIVSEGKKYETTENNLTKAVLNFAKGQFVVYKYKKCRIKHADSTTFSYDLEEVEPEKTKFTGIKERELNKWCLYKQSTKQDPVIMKIIRQTGKHYLLQGKGNEKKKKITALKKIILQEGVNAVFRDVEINEEKEEDEVITYDLGDTVLLQGVGIGRIFSETQKGDALIIYFYDRNEEEGKRKYVTIGKDELYKLHKLERTEFLEGQEVDWNGEEARLISKQDRFQWEIQLKNGEKKLVDTLDILPARQRKGDTEESDSEEDEESDEEESDEDISSDGEGVDEVIRNGTLVTHDNNNDDVFRVDDFDKNNGYRLTSIEVGGKQITEQDNDKIYLYEPRFETRQWVRLKENQKEYAVLEVLKSKGTYALSDGKEYFESKLKDYEPLLKEKDWVCVKGTEKRLQVIKILLRKAKYLLSDNIEYFDSDLEQLEKEEGDEEEEEDEEDDEPESEEEEEEEDEEDDEDDEDESGDEEEESEEEEEDDEDEEEDEEEESEEEENGENGEGQQKKESQGEQGEQESEAEQDDLAPLPPGSTQLEPFSSPLRDPPS